MYGNAAPSNQPRRSHGQLITRRGIVSARYTLGRSIAPCLPSAQAERWVRIFPVCRLPVRFRTCLRRERDRQAQTGARHRRVDDLRLFDVGDGRAVRREYPVFG
jgi:hypothetical protein